MLVDADEVDENEELRTDGATEEPFAKTGGGGDRRLTPLSAPTLDAPTAFSYVFVL